MRYAENLTHMFSFDGEHILLDINSGAVHQLSPQARYVVGLWRRTGCDLCELPERLERERRRETCPDAEGNDAKSGVGAAESVGGSDGGDAFRSADEEAAGRVCAISPGEEREICAGLAELVQEGLLMSELPGLPGQPGSSGLPGSSEVVGLSEKVGLPEAAGTGTKLSSQDQVVKALCLHAAHDCNLRCRYCFAGTGAFGGDRSLMSYETGKKALDFLFSRSGNRRHVEVDYFGGEPLMNIENVKKWILYGEEESARRGKVLKQTLTTNGVLLNADILDFLNRHDVALVLSLDGRREVNDKMRPTANGGGSYDLILPKLKAAVESRGGDNYYLRGTYTRFNKDFFQDVRHMTEAGFRSVSVEPVVAGPGEAYALRWEDLPELFAQYERLARYYLEKRRDGEPFVFFHFNLDLDHGPCLPKRLSGCGAGDAYLAVSPSGVLYPCHQFVGNADFVLGDVEKGILRADITARFRENHALAKEKCRTCWARFYCGGGCHANAWNDSHDWKEPYALGCELEKKRLECAIWIRTKETEPLP